MMCAKFSFMARLPKKRGITQVEEDKSLILRSTMGNSPEVTSVDQGVVLLGRHKFLQEKIAPKITLMFSSKRSESVH